MEIYLWKCTETNERLCNVSRGIKWKSIFRIYFRCAYRTTYLSNSDLFACTVCRVAHTHIHLTERSRHLKCLQVTKHTFHRRRLCSINRSSWQTIQYIIPIQVFIARSRNCHTLTILCLSIIYIYLYII